MNLMEECRELIKSNFSAVMETDDFLNLDAKQVIKWMSGDDIIIKAEEEVFKGIVKVARLDFLGGIPPTFEL